MNPLFHIYTRPAVLVLISIWFFPNLCEATSRRATTISRACLILMAETGLDHQTARAATGRGVNFSALVDHLEHVFRSMTGRGPRETLNLAPFLDRAPEFAAELEPWAHSILDSLFSQSMTGQPTHSQREQQFGEASEVIIGTHLNPQIQNQLEDHIRQNRAPLSAQIPWLYLVDPITPSTHLRDTHGERATLIRPSSGGEFDIPMSASTIHLVGGYLDQCLPSTIVDAARSSLGNPGSRQVTFNIHSQFTYLEGGETLAHLRDRSSIEYRRVISHFRDVLAENFEDSIRGIEGPGTNATYTLHQRNGKTIVIRIL